MESGGRTRTWVEIEGDPETLIIFLHGSRQSGSVARNFTDRQFEALGPTVIYPDGVGRHFNDLRVGFLTELISLYDARTVIGCGFSNGGQMLLRLLYDAPLRLHAAALFGHKPDRGPRGVHADTDPCSAGHRRPARAV